MTPALNQDEAFAVLRRLLPQGRAWQSHDAAIGRDVSVLQQALYAMAGPMAAMDEAAVAMADEFYCSTASQDVDLWLLDYGLPDDCDPFSASLCDKVLFTGGVSLGYYEQLVLAAGWSVDLRWLKGNDDTYPGVYATLHAVIDSANSPAVTEGAAILDGSWTLPDKHLAIVTAEDVVCLLDRIIPAYCAITYEVIL